MGWGVAAPTMSARSSTGGVPRPKRRYFVRA